MKAIIDIHRHCSKSGIISLESAFTGGLVKG